MGPPPAGPPPPVGVEGAELLLPVFTLPLLCSLSCSGPQSLVLISRFGPDGSSFSCWLLKMELEAFLGPSASLAPRLRCGSAATQLRSEKVAFAFCFSQEGSQLCHLGRLAESLFASAASTRGRRPETEAARPLPVSIRLAFSSCETVQSIKLQVRSPGLISRC